MRSKTVPQEIKLLTRLGTAWLPDVGANNWGFLRMQPELTFSETPLQTLFEIARLRSASTVHHTIVSVADK